MGSQSQCLRRQRFILLCKRRGEQLQETCGPVHLQNACSSIGWHAFDVVKFEIFRGERKPLRWAEFSGNCLNIGDAQTSCKSSACSSRDSRTACPPRSARFGAVSAASFISEWERLRVCSCRHHRVLRCLLVVLVRGTRAEAGDLAVHHQIRDRVPDCCHFPLSLCAVAIWTRLPIVACADYRFAPDAVNQGLDVKTMEMRSENEIRFAKVIAHKCRLLNSALCAVARSTALCC